MAQVAQLWRYPIKGIGREAMEHCDLSEGQPMPSDRAWALRHAGAEAKDGWLKRRNFCVVASGPALAPLMAETRGDRLRLTHPERAPLDLDPAQDGAVLIDWLGDLWPQSRPLPDRLVKSPDIGMADNGLAQVSILNLASLRALSQKLGQEISINRFRGNIILDGLAPWEEFDWIGQQITIGNIRFDVTERVERCRATEANTQTGQRDANTLSALSSGWGHRDFGVYATICNDGHIAVGDEVTA